MRLREYIVDRRYLIIFYLILMTFISMVVYLDPTIRVEKGNLIYINVASLILFITYFLWGYSYRKNQYKIIGEIIDNGDQDLISSLPYPKNYEQYICNILLKKLNEEKEEKIEKLHRDKKENLEYITKWVHEIKTPIAVANLIIENSKENIQIDTLKSILEEIDKIEDYVDQALYYSRVDAFSNDYIISEIHLTGITNEVIKKNKKIFINKSISLNLEGDELRVNSDKKWISFIIDQILSNALKYTNKGGRINISYKKTSREGLMIIKDNGIGIRSEDIDRIFDKGFTGFTGRENNKSTGMGLYLAKKLARKLGHDISVESVYGEYTRITIHFPKVSNYLNITKV